AGAPRYSEYDFDRLGDYDLRGSTEELFGARDGEDGDPFGGQDPEWVIAQDEVSIYLRDLGMTPIDMDPEVFDDFTRFYIAAGEDGLTGTEALSYAVNLMAERNQAEAFANNPEPLYEPIDYDEFLSARPFYQGEDRAAAGDIAGYEPDPEAATQRGDDGGSDGSNRQAQQSLGEPETGPIAPGRYAAFDDPVGAGAQGQHDSLRHDARAALDRGEAADPARWQAVGVGDTPDERLLQWTAPDGQQVPVSIIVGDDGRAEISIDPGSQDANRFGPSVLRAALAGFRAAFPEIRGVYGERLTGAGPGRVQQIDGAALPIVGGEATDPAIAARQAEEAQLRADAALRGENRTGEAQDGTMGLALFDEADAPGFRFDEEGKAQSLREVLDELDADEAEIKAIRDCLK
ncbi:MAG: hypothetical protein VX072_06255, partial [Pseudomonadota bacterium]|nr:hypothetical protein [Pseudomonadota bacterium]